MKVLADHGVDGRFASSRIIVRPPAWSRGRPFGFPVLRLVPMVAFATKLWWAGLRLREPGPYVTIGAAHAFVLAFLQLVASPLQQPRTHVVFDLLLERKRSGLAGLVDWLKMGLFRHAIDAAVVWGQADVQIYASEHGIPREKLHFQPFHITLEDYEFEIGDDGFVFAGGNHGRDYTTVVRALAQINYPVLIATQDPSVRSLAVGHPHIEVRGVTPQDFRRFMARSTLVVEAHPEDFFRTAGHQTFLNAMWMGKPFVMADRKSSEGYFEDGRHWFVVDHGDVEALRDRVQALLRDEDLRKRIGGAARREVRQDRYRTLNCMQTIYNFALGIEAQKQGLDPQSTSISDY